MKVGESVPVTIAGQVVAQATVRELGDGTVTLVVPGTIVVMAVRTEIAPDPQQVEETTSETLITGVDRVTDDGTVIEGTPVVERPPVTAPSSNEPLDTPAPVENTEPANENPTVSDGGNENVSPSV